ncbi:hypothetical protein CL614_09800 [archaeon]|nr:hypothetical protein [archaeon]
MGLYKMLAQDFSGDVSRLRKDLVKTILDENAMIESYDMLSLFHADVGIGQNFERQFAQVIFRVKSALPTSTTDEIFGDLMQEVVERESVWADGWQKYYEKVEAKQKYEETSEDFQNYLSKLAQTGTSC